jgi:hypothetical protein
MIYLETVCFVCGIQPAICHRTNTLHVVTCLELGAVLSPMYCASEIEQWLLC